jgi:hypothetical protein
MLRPVQRQFIDLPFAGLIPGKGNVSAVGGYVKSRVEARDSKELAEI